MSDGRINEGFVIVSAIPIGNTEFVLGVNMKNAGSFVTWECKDKIDYFSGRYTDNLLKATRDLCERVMEEVEYLEQRGIRQVTSGKKADGREER